MSFTNVTLQYEEKRMEPFWWITTFFAYTLLLILSLGLIALPIYLMFVNLWFKLLLILVPIGLLMGIRIWQTFRRYIFKQRNPSHYQLDYDHFTYTVTNAEHLTVEEDQISLRSIDQIIVSLYAFQNNHAYTKSGPTESVPRVVIYPSMILVHQDTRGERKFLPMLFHGMSDIDPWLKRFNERHIPFYYTPLPIHELDDEGKVKAIEEEDVLMPYTYETDFTIQHDALEKKWFEEKKHLFEEEEDDEVLPDEPFPLDEPEQTEPKKGGFLSYITHILKTYLFLIIGSLIAIVLAQHGIVDEDGIYVGVILLTITALINFYLLKNHLRWYHIFRFWIETVVITFVVALAYNKYTIIGDEMLTSIAATAILYIFMAWIPFLITIWIRKIQATNRIE